MTRRSQKQRGLGDEELRAQEGLELPDRHVMSLIPTLGADSIGGGGLMGAPAPGGATPGTGATPDPATGTSPDPGTGASPDPGPTSPGPTTTPGPSGEMQTFAPVNKASVLNQLANGSTQSGGASQTAPINQQT
jgi:hypothetical protein